MGVLRTLWTLRNAIIIVTTPLILMPLLIDGSQQAAAGFCLILMAVYWATEVFPIAVTALIPVMLFPMTGLMPGKAVSKTYINDSSMLFVGGLIMAVAIEDWNIHKRIALKLLLIVGTSPTRLMLGMMLPSWFLSMWTSNMATTAMMCPIADALLHELQKGEREGGREPESGTTTSCLVNDPGKVHDYGSLDTDKAEESHALTQGTIKSSQDPAVVTDIDIEIDAQTKSGDDTKVVSRTTPSKEHLQLAKALTISIAYAANVGGTTTITGCASNIILKGQADDIFRERGLSSGITFGSWLVLGFPVSLLIFVFLFLWLTLYFRGCGCLKKNPEGEKNVRDFVKREYKSLGPVRFPEIMVLVLFAVLISLWVSRDLGGAGGWGNLFKKAYVTDSAAPTLATLLLFLIPANLPDFFSTSNRPVAIKPLLKWQNVQQKLPWGLFILFGGGFALAEGCKVSGLSSSIREALTVFSDLPVWLTSLLVALLTSFVTEVVTNTATCTLVLPIIAQLNLSYLSPYCLAFFLIVKPWFYNNFYKKHPKSSPTFEKVVTAAKALGIGVNPLLLMIPTAVATSYAYMLPVATPPNAMVYVLGYFSMGEMMRSGFICNIMSVLILTLGVNTWGAEYFGLRHLPIEFSDTVTTTAVPNIVNSTLSL